MATISGNEFFGGKPGTVVSSSQQTTQNQTQEPGAISQAFQSGLSQAGAGYEEARNATNPFSLVAGSTKLAAGAINTALSPLAPIINPISKGINYATKPLVEGISNIPAIQKFAQTNAGKATARGAEFTGDLSTIGGAVAGGMETPKISGATLGLGGKALETGATKVRPLASRALGTVGERTAEIPSSVIETAVKAPNVIDKAQGDIYKLSNPQVLERLQQGTRNLRTKLTNFYNKNITSVIESNTSKRVGLNEKESSLVTKIADKYNLDIPPNLKSMSVKETMQLNSTLGELKKYSDISSSAEGKPVRDAYSIVRSKVSEFGGADQFLNNYSAKKDVFDAADELFNAYKTRDPKKVASAYRNMQSIFKEDKFAYLKAVDELSRETGGNLVNELKALQLKNILPKEAGTKWNWSDLFRLTFFPITSPRLMGIQAKTLGRIINTAQSTGELMQKLSSALKSK